MGVICPPRPTICLLVATTASVDAIRLLLAPVISSSSSRFSPPTDENLQLYWWLQTTLTNGAISRVKWFLHYEQKMYSVQYAAYIALTLQWLLQTVFSHIHWSNHLIEWELIGMSLCKSSLHLHQITLSIYSLYKLSTLGLYTVYTPSTLGLHIFYKLSTLSLYTVYTWSTYTVYTYSTNCLHYLWYV